MGSLRDKAFQIFVKYCKYRDAIELGELLPCNHPDNKRGCQPNICPLMKELETFAKLARLGPFNR